MSPANPPSPGGSRPGKADWRGGKSKGAPAPARPAAKGAVWKDKPDQPVQRARRRYRTKLGALVLVFFVLVGAFMWMVFFRMAKTPLLVLAATEYASPALPPNAWAQEDADRFVAMETEQQVRLHSVRYRAAPEEPLVGFQDLRNEMKKYARGWWKRKTMIVYLSMHGAVNEKGEPCLIPPGSPPLDSRKWLTLREVLDYLFPPEVRESLPRNKLLILDCNRMDSNWRIGLLANDFAARLPAVVEEAAVPGLAILSSAGPGQIGWGSPEEFRGSVFGHFVFKGLMGSADREADGDDNGQVDSGELAKYVRNNVRRWVQDHRADLQEPILIPEGVERFPLAHALSKADLARVEAKEAKSSAGPAGPGAGRDTAQDAAQDESKKSAASASRRVTAEDLWDNVGDLWLKHEQLDRAGRGKPWNRDPLKWQDFQHRLLQQERWLMAGEAYQGLARQNRTELERLAEELSQDPVAAGCAAHSLPLAVWLAKDPNAAAAAEGLKKRWDAPPGKLDVPPGQPYVELHFLAMLRSYLDPPVWQQGPELIRQALAVRELAEVAAAPPDERVHYWAWRPVDQADALRRVADDRLFVGTAAALKQAATSYGELSAAAGPYRTAQDRAGKMRDAFEVRDRAWAKAPYLAQWLFARLREGEPTAEETRTTHLRTLLVGTRQLAAELDQALDVELRRQQDPLLPGEAAPSVQKSYQAVAVALEALEGDFAGRCTRLLEAGGEDRLVLKEVSTVLAVPLATGQRRRALWDRYFKLATAGSGREAPASGERAPDAKQAPRPAEGESPAHRHLAAWVARWGEHPALAMLKFGSEPEAPAKPVGSDARLDPTLLWQQGGLVRVRLGGLNQDVVRHSAKTESLQKSESATASLAEIRLGYSLADQGVRAYAPLLGSVVPLETGTRDEPIAQLRKLDFRYLQLWHAYRTLEDFWGPEPANPAGKPFFQTAAEDYLRSARDLCPAAPVRQYGKTELVGLLQRRQAAAGPCVQPDVKQVTVFDPEVPAEVPLAASVAKDLPGGEAALLLESVAGKRPLATFDKPAEARKKESEAPGQRRTGVPVQGNPWSRSHWIRSNDKLLETPQFEAVALYRGHRREKRFTIVSGTGYDVVWEPPRRQATVSVEGARKAASYVVFILDYSGSMDVDVGGEAKAAAGAKNETRYGLAQRGLGYLLKRLAKLPDNPYRVEVMLYGHRFGWATSKLIQEWRFPPQTRTYTWDPQNPGSIIPADNLPRAVLPSEDVERLWPASWPPQHGLTEQEASKIEEVLRRQRPVGDTPLYLAIQQAIRDLDAVPGNFAQPGAPSRHIVAITDGVNWQDFRRTDRLTGADVVEEALAKRPDIRLDVVGFLLSGDREEAKRQLQKDADNVQVDVENFVARYDDLKGLVEKHKGRFYTVMDPTTLGARLEESLRLSRYVVYREEGGKPAGPRPAPRELSDPFDVPLPRSDPQQADAGLDWAGVPHAAELADSLLKARAQLWLRGEEGLRLYLSEDGQRLEHRFFDAESREGKEFAHPRFPGRRLAIVAHEPRPEADGVHFRFSVQNGREDAWQFSPRPLDGWIEIRPVPADARPDDNPPLYVFYDLRFEPKQTTPVIECVVPNWPEGVHSAQVGLWCKFQGTDPDRSIPVDEFSKPQQVEGISLDLQVEPDEKQDQFRVLVTEQGHPADAQLNRFRVGMRPVPLKAVHHYVPEARTIRHTFVYPYAARSDPRSSFVVEVTTRAKVLDGAIPVPKLTVAVPDRPR